MNEPDQERSGTTGLRENVSWAANANNWRTAKRSTFLALSLAFTVTLLAAVKRAEKTTSHRVPGQHRTATTTEVDWSKVPVNVGGWAALVVFIVVMVDIQETATLGQAFAWLILIGALLTNGPAAMELLREHSGGTVNLKEHTPT